MGGPQERYVSVTGFRAERDGEGDSVAHPVFPNRQIESPEVEKYLTGVESGQKRIRSRASLPGPSLGNDRIMADMRMTRAEVDEFRALHRKEGRTAGGMFLLEGWRALAEAIDGPIDCVAVREDMLDRPELEALRARGIPIREVNERDARRISATEQSQGVVARVRVIWSDVTTLFRPGDAIVLALDAVGDPGNLGTILRTASWFGARGVLLGRGCVDPFNDKVVRSTAGSLFHVPMVGDIDLPLSLGGARSAGYQVVVADAARAVDLPDWRPSRRCVLVMGSETHGPSPSVRAAVDLAVRVPRFGRGESLNVAIAAGILLAHMRMHSRS